MTQTHTSAWDKFLLLSWKNWLIQLRHPIQTAFEILIPVLVCAFLILIRSLVDVTIQETPIFFNGINMEWQGFPEFINMTRGIVNNTSPPTQNPHILTIGYSPMHPSIDQVMSRVISRMDNSFELQGFLNSSMLATAAVASNFFISFQFDDELFGTSSLPNEINYAVRFPAELRRNDSLPNDLGGFSSNWATNIRFGLDFLPGPRNSRADDGGQPPGYIRQGFTMIQNIVERELIRELSNDMTLQFPQLIVQRYPFPEYVNDILGLILEFAIPIIFMVAFLYSAINNIKYIAIEKELQLKEAMKIMGLSSYLHWIAWFTKCILFQIVIISIVTGLVKIPFESQGGLAVFTHTDWSVLWVFFFLYSLAGVTFSFMMSTFFAKANVAAIAGAVAWLFMLNPYSIININYDSIGLWPKIGASLLVNSGMGFGFKVLGRYESAMIGVQWYNLFTPVTPDDDMTLGYVMLALLTASFIQMILALYIEKVKPGEFGVAEPWYFPVSIRYWRGSSAKGNESINAIPMQRNPNYEDEPSNKNAGIKIRGLRKVYGNKVAVNNLNLNIYENEITVLLGHNGAGKSTTMGMLTGLFSPSQGTALINGLDIRNDLNKIRGSLGLCPQHNVLFNELTVREHIIFFSKLKGIKNKNEIENQIKKYVDLLGLEPKMNAQSSTLSGGMKRKLSIGIALCGNSKIVMCDEPSSGMDPAARRALWDLLIQEKQGRTVLLTTHFMDEADILGDRIAIMADGELKTVGTSFFLKKRFGVGYRLTLVKKPLCNPNTVTQFLSRYIRNISVESNIGTELSYILPEEKTRHFRRIFKDLEDNLDVLKVLSFGLSLTTMEEVFLKVGTDSLAINEEFEQPSYGNYKGINGNGYMNANGKVDTESSKNLLEGDLVYGTQLFFNQTLAMFMKKFYYTIRSYIMLFIMFFIPIVFLVITMAFDSFTGGFDDLPKLRISFLEYLQTVTVYEVKTENPIMENYITNYLDFMKDLPDEHTIRETADGLSMEDTILNEYRASMSNVNLNYMVGTTFKDNSIIAWFNNQAFHTVPLTVNLINNVFLRKIMGAEYKINLSNKPLPFSLSTTFTQIQAGNNLGFNLALNTGFSFALVTACFVMFYIKERITKAKLLQIVSGANKVIFWAVAFIFDYGIYFLIMIVYILATAAYQKVGFSTFEELSRNTIVLLAFGLAALPYTYVLSFAFRVPTTGVVTLTIGYIVTGTLFYTVYFTLHSDLLDLKWISVPLGWTFLIFPHFSLTRAYSNLNIMQTTIAACDRNCELLGLPGGTCETLCNVQDCRGMGLPSALCDAQDTCCTRNFYSFDENAIGIMLTALVAVSLVSFFILFILEFKVIRTFINYLRNRRVPKNFPESEDGYIDSDVFEEKKKLRMFGPYYIAKNNLVIKDLSKFYGNFMAVNQLCVGVDRGECFGLLGVNGAGKTSTFKMLTGDENISSGDAWVDGFSIRNELNEVHQRIGYCPQFDALIDDLTGRETLKIFALIRGVPRKDINAIAIQLAEDLNFTKHLDKKTKEYSGGNKRKLSTALTLIGDPSVIYLDEPTSGMDVGARRQLWNMVIKTRNSGKSVVLTSHSMEECEVLCNRLAIMVNGEFKCLGSVQHLKNKFSKGFFLTIKAGHDTNMQRLQQKLNIVKSFVEGAFNGAVLKEEYMDILTYHITSANIKWSEIFGIMEDAKASLNILDYSLGQTSLEQIFLFFTKYQRIAGKKTN